MINISICMATYNGEKYIAEQIDSILMQMRDADELVISDDSSSDNTIEIIKRYKDPRIKLYEGNKFRSPILNFEYVIKCAKNSIITLADQDDVWLDGKLDLIRKYFLINNVRSVLVMDNYVVDMHLNIVNPSLFELINSGNGFFKNLKKNTFLGCNLAFTSDLLKYILPFPKGIPMHDIWIGLVSTIFAKVTFIPERTILFRRHMTNATKLKNSLFQKLIWRFLLLWSLGKIIFKSSLKSLFSV